MLNGPFASKWERLDKHVAAEDRRARRGRSVVTDPYEAGDSDQIFEAGSECDPR